MLPVTILSIIDNNNKREELSSNPFGSHYGYLLAINNLIKQDRYLLFHLIHNENIAK